MLAVQFRRLAKDRRTLQKCREGFNRPRCLDQWLVLSSASVHDRKEERERDKECYNTIGLEYTQRWTHQSADHASSPTPDIFTSVLSCMHMLIAN